MNQSGAHTIARSGAVIRVFAFAAVALCAALSSAAGAWAAPLAHGHLLRVVRPRTSFNANQSSDWFGYNQGLIEQNKQFHSISGEWVVPRAVQHAAGETDGSSDWVGIGGGCVDANCNVMDSTLIQTGTEQDVDSSGGTYYAWYELLPAPSIQVNMTVKPGDVMLASVAEAQPNSEVWTITLKDLTRGETFSQTVPYSSSYATAEWITETPLDATSGGFTNLPNLSVIPFDQATTNGAPAGLNASEEMQLVDQNNNVIGAPSAPDPEKDGFNDCAWATSCGAPFGSIAVNSPSGPANPSSPGQHAVCKVPKVKGKKLARAKRALRAAHCAVGKVRKRKVHGKRRGTVISQSVRPGRTLPAGSKVNLVVAA